jgi:hypothetical protein
MTLVHATLPLHGHAGARQVQLPRYIPSPDFARQATKQPGGPPGARTGFAAQALCTGPFGELSRARSTAQDEWPRPGAEVHFAALFAMWIEHETSNVGRRARSRSEGESLTTSARRAKPRSARLPVERAQSLLALVTGRANTHSSSLLGPAAVVGVAAGRRSRVGERRARTLTRSPSSPAVTISLATLSVWPSTFGSDDRRSRGAADLPDRQRALLGRLDRVRGEQDVGCGCARRRA